MRSERLAVLFALTFFSALVSCNDPEVEPNDGGVMVFDVSSSDTNCPDGLYEQVSEAVAQCTHAPEMCVSEPGASQIVCNCAPGTGGSAQGQWACHESPDE